MVNPHLYSDIKKGTKQFIDDASKVTNAVGKSNGKSRWQYCRGASKMFSGFFWRMIINEKTLFNANFYESRRLRHDALIGVYG